jgi:precorrin-6Y C5,15-methyltransferase (decarboxylating)
MTPIQVVGIGLDGAAGLVESVQQIVNQATLLMGSDRHLSYFPQHPAKRVIITNFHQAIQIIRQNLNLEASQEQPTPDQYACSSIEDEFISTGSTPSAPLIVVLTSGDPLFFGLGRLLLAELPPETLTFHPHLSAVQLAFNRIKLPWQDARLISAHGRSLDELVQALQQGVEKIAVLTDPTNTPSAIARLLLALDLPSPYQLWVCENLAGTDERVRQFEPEQLSENCLFAPLNVVVLLRSVGTIRQPLNWHQLPALGLPDHSFLSFSDRPGLMTKREVRLLALGELTLQPGQVIWDIGAGTGSVSIEIARLFPSSQVFAIEQTAAGASLVQQNSQRFQVENVTPVHGTAPAVLQGLPNPNRVFIGGSGGNLTEILAIVSQALQQGGVVVLALATLEHLAIALDWYHQRSPSGWQYRLLQVQLSRSIPVGALTRFNPLNPVTLLTFSKQ